MERRKLTPAEVAQALTGREGWEYESGIIQRRYTFDNFAKSLDFVNKIGAIAEAMDHHPDISFGWGYAEISTTTHDRGGVTDVDLALAGQIDTIE